MDIFSVKCPYNKKIGDISINVDGISSDLLAVDVRQALYHFGELTGEITNDELLGNIFSKFLFS